jgi:taurine dioxygenase
MAVDLDGRHALTARQQLERERGNPMSVLTNITYRPVTGTIGAEVLRVDVRNIGSQDMEVLHQAFLDRCVLVFRDQHLGAQELLDFTARWGEIYTTPYATKLDGFPQVLAVVNVGKAKTITEAWHSDATFLEQPPAHGILAAQTVPEAGGDTMFANQYAAYESLSPTLRQAVDGLRAVHEDHVLAPAYGIDDPDARPMVHPVVRTHPETGRRCLFVNSLYTMRFDGMTSAESEGLLSYLTTHSASPDLCYRHHWQPGDVVMWDNRCAQHYAVHDHGDAERVLYRTTIAGDRPR